MFLYNLIRHNIVCYYSYLVIWRYPVNPPLPAVISSGLPDPEHHLRLARLENKITELAAMAVRHHHRGGPRKSQGGACLAQIAEDFKILQ